MITALIWTYSGDADLVPLCVASFDSACQHAGWRRHEDYRIVVIDDATQPCPAETREACLAAGAGWEDSDYWRMGSLNGHLCIMGMLADMISEGSHDAADTVVVKIDSDTIVRGVDWLIRFMDDRRKLVTGADDRGNMYGMCYALWLGLVPDIIKSLELVPVHRMAPEDQTIGYRARLLGGDGAWLPIPMWAPEQLPHSSNGRHGVATPYYWDGRADHPDYLQCEIITLGTSFYPIPRADMLRVFRALMPPPFVAFL